MKIDIKTSPIPKTSGKMRRGVRVNGMPKQIMNIPKNPAPKRCPAENSSTVSDSFIALATLLNYTRVWPPLILSVSI
jgi:hypothetical protein